MEPPASPEARVASGVLRAPAQVARRIVQRYGRRLVLVFLLVALPLWAFGELAEEVLEGEPFVFDAPLQNALHALSSPGMDRFFIAVSAVGYSRGVVPADVLLVIVLALRGHPRSAVFAAVATGGSGLLNMAAKHALQRARPDLWLSPAPELTYSFPSGHAMASATLACVLACLAWNTRWRVPAIAAGAIFVLAVGVSRVYLGVHYPSDVLAGWTAAIAWTLGVRFIAFRRGLVTGSARV